MAKPLKNQEVVYVTIQDFLIFLPTKSLINQWLMQLTGLR